MAQHRTVEHFVETSVGHDLATIVAAVAWAAREIAQKIRLAGLDDIYGAFGAVNVQGEQQQKLDVFANDVLIQALSNLPSVAAIVSEEDEGPLVFEHQGKLSNDSEFVVIFDPLDGSSNIDVNVNVGTIFSIVRVTAGLEPAMLQPGTAQVAAGYVVYGPSCVMVLALPSPIGVSAFTLDAEGHFVLTAEQMKMPGEGPYYSANDANAQSWPPVYRDFVAGLIQGSLGGTHSARYIGSLVADFHRTLLKGGVFLYPPTAKAPQGKLRLLYEARPLAMIAEQACGAATNGADRILDLLATGIHDRTALVVGSRVEVEGLQSAISTQATKT